MSRLKDLIGKRIGKLVPIEYYIVNGKTIWKCRCDCGNITEVFSTNLTRFHTISCGCIRNKQNKERSIKHNMSNTRIYKIFLNVKNRCNNPNNSGYKNYGGRGIKVCDEWLDKDNGFINFYNWSMENGYKDNLTIDRINVDENYEPNNCRWISISEQQRNRRNNRKVTIDGETYVLKQWCRILGQNYTNIYQRMYKGMNIYEALLKNLKNSEYNEKLKKEIELLERK